MILVCIFILLCVIAATNITAVWLILGLRNQVRADMNDMYLLIRQKIHAFLEVFRKAKKHESE